MTQLSAILRYLEEHGSLTQLEAFNRLGVCRLSERCRELERLGWTIEHQWVSVPTRNPDRPARVVRYRIVSGP